MLAEEAAGCAAAAPDWPTPAPWRDRLFGGGGMLTFQKIYIVINEYIYIYVDIPFWRNHDIMIYIYNDIIVIKIEYE